MTRRFMRIMTDLQNSTSFDEKKSLSKEASVSLMNDSKYVKNFLHFIFSRLVLKAEISPYSEIANNDFYEVKVVPYEDIDGFYKISIRMTYLQDFENSQNDLDMKVSLLLYEELKNSNLDIIVNDICVNDVQIRNGQYQG